MRKKRNSSVPGSPIALTFAVPLPMLAPRGSVNSRCPIPLLRLVSAPTVAKQTERCTSSQPQVLAPSWRKKYHRVDRESVQTELSVSVRGSYCFGRFEAEQCGCEIRVSCKEGYQFRGSKRDLNVRPVQSSSEEALAKLCWRHVKVASGGTIGPERWKLIGFWHARAKCDLDHFCDASPHSPNECNTLPFSHHVLKNPMTAMLVA